MYSRPIKGKNLTGFLFSILISTGIILVSLRIWELDLSLPYSFSGDGLLGGILVKSIRENGLQGLWFCNRLGAPETSALIDMPILDLETGLVYFLLTRFFSEPYVCLYLQYFSTYMFCALAMYLLVNRYTDRVWLKVILAVAYTITPYHFMRGIGHQTLSNYYVIPVAIYLMNVIYEEPFCGIFPVRYKGHIGKKFVLLFSCFVLGFGNVYYVFFGLICMMMAFIGKLFRTKKGNCFLHEGVPIYTVIAVAVIGLLPKLIYAWNNGANTVAGVRYRGETDFYSLRIVQMLMPCNYNRVGFLANIANEYSSKAANINENVCSSLGIMASFGFLFACVWVIWRLVKPNVKDKTLVSTMNITSLCILVLVLYSLYGSFGSLFSYLVTPELRALNRSSVVIAGLSLCVICFVLEYVLDNVHVRWKRVGSVCAAVVVFGFSVYSEIPLNGANWQAGVKQEDQILKKFFSQIEDTMDDGAMIYELPFMVFPETEPIHGMMDYQPGLGYYYTNTLKWSYGGMKGRNQAAEDLNQDEGMSRRFVKGIMDSGFTGIYIDTSGFADGGKGIMSFYTDQLGLTPIISDDNWLVFYDLRGCQDILS